MATKQGKKRRRTMPDLDELSSGSKSLRESQQAVESLKAIDLLGVYSSAATLSEETAILWLLARHGIELVFKLTSCCNNLPQSLTKVQFVRYLSQYCKLPEEEVGKLLTFIRASCPSILKLLTLNEELPLVVAPPVDTCLECSNRLVSNHSCRIRYYSKERASLGEKVTLRCTSCKLFYNPTQYGNKVDIGFRFYPGPISASVNLVEATDAVYAERSLLELQCSLANHSWVSFQGFAESYNVALDLSKDIEITPEIVSELFYNGELELELNRIGLGNYHFKLNCDREKCFEQVEAVRRTSVYSHAQSECCAGCKERGCGTLWVTDGIWKVNFPHCMYRVETVVDGMSIALPDVCTESPVRRKAFCLEHCNMLEKEAKAVPTGLAEFLKYCHELQKDSDNVIPEIEAVEAVLQDLPLSTVPVERSVAASQGTDELVKQVVDKDALTNEGQLCRKDTGRHSKLRKWSRGHQFVIRGGGHIDAWQPLYMSESPSQVLLILIQWLLSLSKEYGGPSKLPDITLAYDNMCNLNKLKVARKPLPLPPPLDQLWQNVHKIIDVFHFPNHVGIECKELYNPKDFKDKHPNYNTQAGEQSFSWISRFKHILCAMPKNHHLFYLHRMVLRRNSYTTRCYQSGRKPILPKKR